jgi:hypothetical protein
MRHHSLVVDWGKETLADIADIMAAIYTLLGSTNGSHTSCTSALGSAEANLVSNTSQIELKFPQCVFYHVLAFLALQH